MINMKLEREEERGRTKTKTETETNTKKQIQKTNTNTRDKQTNTVIQWPEVSSRVRIWRESSNNQTWLTACKAEVPLIYISFCILIQDKEGPLIEQLSEHGRLSLSEAVQPVPICQGALAHTQAPGKREDGSTPCPS